MVTLYFIMYCTIVRMMYTHFLYESIFNTLYSADTFITIFGLILFLLITFCVYIHPIVKMLWLDTFLKYLTALKYLTKGTGQVGQSQSQILFRVFVLVI